MPKPFWLNNLHYQYDNVIFTLSGSSSHTLEDMIPTLLVEEKRAAAGDSNIDNIIVKENDGKEIDR